MKSKLLISSFIATLVLGFGAVVSSPAVNAFDIKDKSQVCSGGGADSAFCKTDATKNPIYGPDGIITKVTQVLAVFIGVAAVIVLVIAGISMMTSGGEPNKIATTRRMILFACIGIVVAALGQAIVSFVLSKL